MRWLPSSRIAGIGNGQQVQYVWNDSFRLIVRPMRRYMNWSTRTSMRRYTRLSNGFSRKLENQGMPTALLPVPSEVRLEGDSLVAQSLQPGDRAVAPPRDLLLQFTQITTAHDVVTFARRYGLLQPHHQEAIRRWEEPLTYWFQVVRQAKTILNLASAMYQDRPTSVADWRVAFEGVKDQTALPFLLDERTPTPEAARFLLSMLLNEWLTAFDVRPELDWIRTTPTIVLSRTLRAALALDLVVAVTRTKQLVVCSACGQPYLRERRQPKQGQQNYCVGCRQDGAPARHAATRYRARVSRRPRPARQRTRGRTAGERAVALLKLQRALGSPPRGAGAGAYWREFLRRARANGLLTGQTAASAQMACRRAQERVAAKPARDPEAAR